MADSLTTQTIDAVPEQGITAMEPSAALSNIDSWISTLDGASFDNAPQVRSGLTTLKQQLQASPRDGAAIGQTLMSLGSMTTQAAGGDAALSTLGATLTRGGRALSGQKA